MALKMQGSPSGSSEQKALPKKGSRPARLVKVIDLGVHAREYKGETKKPAQMIALEFDCVDDKFTFDEEVGPQPIRLNTGYHYPLAVTFGQDGLPHEKSKLRRFIRALDPENNYDYDLGAMCRDKLPCFLVVEHNEKEGNDLVYANIADVTPVPEIDGYEVSDTDSEPFVFDLDDYTEEDWNMLPEFIQEIIKTANNYVPF